jgi:NAD(P)-dependent dehydrogenase (short-subunit alcohol dehydrogenase family)
MTGKPLALVAGGSSGIGYALAQQCLRHGFSVIITGANGCRPLGAVAGTGKRKAST